MKNTLRLIRWTAFSVFFVPFLASAAQVTVTVGAGTITPANITINPGDTVVWTNTSGTNQSVTANNGSFQSGTIAPNGSFAALFNAPGAYPYYDNAGGSAITASITVAQSGAQTNPNAGFNANVGTTQPQSSAAIAAQTQALIAQIQTLQAQLQGSGTGASAAGAQGSCPSLGRALAFGSSGSDVAALQGFLARNASVYPQGLVTGYFGSATQAAVQRFQAQFGIVSSGSPATTGYGVIGPRTIAAIAQACAGGLSASSGSGNSSGTSSNTVSGYMQVSPISGAAPLVVNASVTVNTANSCTGAAYTIAWGDNSTPQTITVQPGNCSQLNQVLQHTYQTGGTYQVVLSAGSHQSTATVTVSGGNTGPASNPAQPVGSITAFTTSGNAPLNVTFYVSCASGLAYDVVYGDGQELGASGVAQTTCNGGLQSIPHTYTAAGSYTAQLIVFVRNSQGAVSTQNVGTMQITVNGQTPAPTATTTIVGYAPPTANTNVGGNVLAVSLQFFGDTCTGAYSIDWGDGALSVSPTVDFTACSQTQTKNYTVSHTYQSNGTYQVVLKRGLPGSSSVQTDSPAFTIIH